jgi:peptidoglycan/LPS O-acetylase OafA/YrhL
VDTDAPASFRRLVHVPALDVLRAFAVSIVVLSHIWEVAPFYHWREIFSNSGFLGVDLFFVLSGFLITALLLQEQHDSGTIRLRRFYLRRAIRLLPALFALLIVYLVYANATGWPPFGSQAFVLESVRATLLYSMNWQVLWNPFAAGDLVALWSLAIEEQFYFVWPLAVIAFVGISHGARRIVPTLAGIVVAVTIWRVIVYHLWGWEAAYLRTETRIDGLILGALVASLFVRGLTPARLPRWTPWAVVAVWFSLMLTVKADAGFAYQGGITLWILASAVMVLYCVSDPQPLRSWPALGAEKVGKVSYAIYLWQVPVIRAIARWADDWPDAVRFVVALVAIGVCSTLSWFLIERPAQRFRRRLEARRLEAAPALPTADAPAGPTG